MTKPSDPAQQKGLTPDGLASQLFDVAFAQNPTDPRGAGRQVADFLGASLLYALRSSKSDMVVYLTEALLQVVAATSEDDAARKDVLKKLSDTFASAANAQPVQTGTPAVSKP